MKDNDRSVEHYITYTVIFFHAYILLQHSCYRLHPYGYAQYDKDG